MRFPLLALIVALACMVSQSVAQAGGTDQVMWSDTVEELFQTPDESDQAFRIRVFQRMRRFTRDTGYEASGHFCRDEQGRMGIIITTWRAHFSAPSMMGCPLALGLQSALGRFVHTHPLPGRYIHTEQDLDQANLGRKWLKKKGGAARWVGAGAAGRFSAGDYAIGPGWLVADDRVLYQEGRGTAREVLRLPPLP